MKKLKNVWNVILKVLTNVRTHTEKLLVPKIEFSPFSTFSHKNRKGLEDGGKTFSDHMMKLKVVEHQKLKALTYVRTHVEELLVSKI